MYSIPLTDFQAATPTNPQSYDISDRITRDTFISVLIDSFRKSRGNPNAQYLFFEWLMENDGFDYKTTLGNFMGAGGWDCLSNQEHTMFLSAFRKVRKHVRNPGTSKEYYTTDKRVVEVLHYFAKMFTNPKAYQKGELVSPVQVNGTLNGME